MSITTSEPVTLRISYEGQVISQRRMDEETAHALLDTLRSPGWVGQIFTDSGSVYIERYIPRHAAPEDAR
jgi:hypothetical protein